MIYHFLGNMECPSWLLEEICSTFSNMTVLKFKDVCIRASNFAIQGHDKPILGDTSEGINISNQHENVLLVANWFLLKPAGYDCSPKDLQKEVMHLGLPTEHSKELKHIYAECKDELMKKIQNGVHREDNATINNSSSVSFTMRTSDQTYNVSMGTSMMNQFKNDIENSLTKMRDFADILPSH